MKSHHTLLAALGVVLLGGGVMMACTSPNRLYGTTGGTTTSGTGGASTGTGTSSGAGGADSTSTGSGTMSSGTGTTSTLPCTALGECPGKDTECQHRVCTGGFCGIELIATGTEVSFQNPGDCHHVVCDGQGALLHLSDNTDVPDDENPCTLDTCVGGMPTHSAGVAGTKCGVNGTLTCDDLSNCVGCAAPTDCPGVDDDCKTRTCDSTVCGFAYQMTGTLIAKQDAGDCKQKVCNGMGGVSQNIDPADIAVDAFECTLDACSNGSPTHAFIPAASPCPVTGGSVCDGSGSCVECVLDANCSGKATECTKPACTANKCGYVNVANGTPLAFQTTSDCHKGVCDGAGSPSQAIDDTDAQQDSNLCTTESCSGGVIVHANVAANTPCGGQNTCDGLGNCIGCNTGKDCPGMDTECQTRTCSNGLCGFKFTPVNNPVQAQIPADCQQTVCDGAGNLTIIPDDTDVSFDAADCTDDICSNGSPMHPAKPAGTACSSTGTVCNGIGGCGECIPFHSMQCGCLNQDYCCGLPQAHAGDPSDEPGAVPDMLCCCDLQFMFCDSTGVWGPCQ